MNLTIAQFTFGLKFGGQERVVVDLSKAFHYKGHRSIVCTTQFGGELVQELQATGVDFHCFSLKRSYDLRALLPVMHYMKHNKVNVVITHGMSGCLVPRLAAVICKIPAIIHVEHSISDNKKFYHVLSDKFISAFIDKIVCVSEDVLHSLDNIEKVPRDKVAVIHNGLDTERFSRVIKDNGNHPVACNKRVGIVANFSEAKGHIYFVEAAEQIVKEYQDIEFILVGEGPLRQMIEDKVCKAGLARYFQFLGSRKDIGELLQTFDIFLLSSVYEGLPISLLEAHYFGLASVATRVGGIPEVIEDGYNGILVPPRNPISLSQAVLKLIKDDRLRSEIGVNAHNICMQKFTLNTMSNRYIDLIHQIIEKHNQ